MKSFINEMLDSDVRFFDVVLAYVATIITSMMTIAVAVVLPYLFLEARTDAASFPDKTLIGFLIFGLYLALFVAASAMLLFCVVRLVKVRRLQKKNLIALLKDELKRD